MDTGANGLVVEGTDGPQEGEVVCQFVFPGDGVRKEAGEGHTHVPYCEAGVEYDVKRETDLEEAFRDWPLAVDVWRY